MDTTHVLPDGLGFPESTRWRGAQAMAFTEMILRLGRTPARERDTSEPRTGGSADAGAAAMSGP